MNERAPTILHGKPIVTETAGVTVTKTGIFLGAEISGVDLRSRCPTRSSRRSTTRSPSTPLIVFRNQNITSDNLMDFGRRFGELTVHPFAPTEGNAPVLIKFRNDETTPPFGTDVWHSDETFRAEPPRATVLCAKDDIPAVGGDTMFAQHGGGVRWPVGPYAAVRVRTRSGARLQAVQGAVRHQRGRAQEAARFELKYPPQIHPVVRVHPVSGRKALFVNPQFTIAIKDMDERESRVLLDTLFQQMLIPEYQFRHHWTPHAIAMWDNRQTVHYAVHDYYPQRRYMERVTIKGGPVTGVPRAEADSVRKIKFAVPEGVDRYGGHKVH